MIRERRTDGRTDGHRHSDKNDKTVDASVLGVENGGIQTASRSGRVETGNNETTSYAMNRVYLCRLRYG